MERGLSELVMLCLGKPLDKTYQVSDWEGRPLLQDQLTYAG
jgi:ribonuclease D